MLRLAQVMPHVTGFNKSFISLPACLTARNLDEQIDSVRLELAARDRDRLDGLVDAGRPDRSAQGLALARCFFFKKPK
jgi:hypothetical protein